MSSEHWPLTIAASLTFKITSLQPGLKIARLHTSNRKQSVIKHKSKSMS